MERSINPIPRPIGEKWKDIRLRHIPVFAYLVCVGLVVYLWNQHWTPSTFVGEVQAAFAIVSSAQEGRLTDLSVRQFERVTKGQVVGKVAAQTPGATDANLAAIRTDLEVMRARMTLDQHRNDQNYQQQRVEYLSQRVDLSIARAKLRFAQSELDRNQKLLAEHIISQFDYETALDNRDALAAEVRERELLVGETERSLTAMKPTGPADREPLVLETIDKAIKAQEEQFRESAESILRAPIDGIVTKVYRNPGENIMAGEQLLTISSERGENIIGFLRQPISFEPKAGDLVMVRSRGNRRQIAEARIVKVGARLELFTQPLRVRGFDSSQERGLPVLIDLPEGMPLYPGELVDLSLKN
jgi:multidrug resistance efflux pump